MEQEYKNREFYIKIWKDKGRMNTQQIYCGTKEEILTCIASMLDRLLTLKIITPEELHYCIEMVANRIINKK